ncbi:hypothetical protein [Pseudoalteromonas sp. TAB23]|uniref:hypothetical protein n=1 Tax=Pseudoalteromonas sp. TAB23 TaxID=1938595 RepID=UPI000466919A|nr:hypothetical protein [Pseudoalteromonas sp. TAB23]
MDKYNFIELIQNKTILVRERTHHSLKKRLKELGVTQLLESPKVRVKSYVTNIRKPIGSIFNGTL